MRCGWLLCAQQPDLNEHEYDAVEVTKDLTSVSTTPARPLARTGENFSSSRLSSKTRREVDNTDLSVSSHSTIHCHRRLRTLPRTSTRRTLSSVAADRLLTPKLDSPHSVRTRKSLDPVGLTEADILNIPRMHTTVSQPFEVSPSRETEVTTALEEAQPSGAPEQASEPGGEPPGGEVVVTTKVPPTQPSCDAATEPGVADDQGVAVFVVSAPASQAHGSVIYNTPEPAVPSLPTKRDHNYVTGKFNAPCPAPSVAAVHKSPPASMLKPHTFRVSRKWSRKTPPAAAEKPLPDDSDSTSATITTLADQPQVKQYFSATPSWPAETILREVEGALRSREGIKVKRILEGKLLDANLTINGDSLALRVDAEVAAKKKVAHIPISTIIGIYTWADITKDPQIQAQMVRRAKHVHRRPSSE